MKKSAQSRAQARPLWQSWYRNLKQNVKNSKAVWVWVFLNSGWGQNKSVYLTFFTSVQWGGGEREATQVDGSWVQIQKEVISDLKRESHFLSKEIQESIWLNRDMLTGFKVDVYGAWHNGVSQNLDSEDRLKIPQNKWIKNVPKESKCTQSLWQINIVINRCEAFSSMPWIKSSIKYIF
jgi:hypothetical protein